MSEVVTDSLEEATSENSVQPSSSKSNSWLSNLQDFGKDALGSAQNFMSSDIAKFYKLQSAFSGFNFSDLLSSLGNMLKNLGSSALGMLKDMLNDAILSLENASINFVSNLAEDLYNNIRAMLYIPDSAFAITLKGMYYAGADLAYSDHYIRKSALKRDWAVSLEFIDEKYGIDYDLRDYTDLESDLSTCSSNSCVNNLYYIFTKMHDQIKELEKDNKTYAYQIDPYTTPIYGYDSISLSEAKSINTEIYCDDGSGTKVSIDMSKPEGLAFVSEHDTYSYYKHVITGYTGIDDGLDDSYEYETSLTKETVESKYTAYKDNKDLIASTRKLMVKYFKNLIVYSYTYLTASSVQKFFTDFDDTLKPKYYGSTDDLYNEAFSFTQNDCLIMMPTYTGNSTTKTDSYTAATSAYRQQQYLDKVGTESESAKASNKSSLNYTGNDGTESAGTHAAVLNGITSAGEKIQNFRQKSMSAVTSNKSSTYSSQISNGIKSVSDSSNGLWSRSGSDSEVGGQSKNKISSMYDRETVKFYEMVGALSDLTDGIDFLNKDTNYIILRNKNIKQIYAVLSNSALWADDRMVNQYFYKRCQIKTMNLLNQSLSKVTGILGSTYAVQALFDLEDALDSSAYVYLKKVEDYLLDPKTNSYNGLDTMFKFDGQNMWTQFGDYFKQAYTWDDSVGSDSKIDALMNSLNEKSSTSSSSSKSVSTSVSEVDDDTTVLTSSVAANQTVYNTVLTKLDDNSTADTYVSNVMRFVSSMTMLELRNLLIKYLTMFYNFMKARNYTPDTYFLNLIESMSDISGITNPASLSNSVFSNSTQKSLLANTKFLISAYALRNSYEYFLTDQNDSNKEELTKLYDMVFALGAADIQMSGTIAALNKFDREELNSLTKQNFFTSISHLKSINDKSNALIKTAPGYKDSLTKLFANKFDPRGVFGYSFDNNKMLYITEHSTGDWNSVGVSSNSEIGSFFCKSNINGETPGIYRRGKDDTELTQLTVSYHNGTIVSDRNLYVIPIEETGDIYFGLADVSTSNPATYGSIFYYDSDTGTVNGISGFTDNPKNYEFIADKDHNLLIISSKLNKGCYYTTLCTTTCTQGASSGSYYEIAELHDKSLVVYPTNETGASVIYFDKSGNYVNTCNMPSGVTGISSSSIVENNATLNLTVTTTVPATTEGAAATTTTTIVPHSIVLYGILFGTKEGIVHCVVSSNYDSVTGKVTGTSKLVLGKTYRTDSETSTTLHMNYIFDDTIIYFIENSKIYYNKLSTISTLPVISSSGTSFDNLSLFEYSANPVLAENITYENVANNILQPSGKVISTKYTPAGIYVLFNRDSIETNECYFLPSKYTGSYPKMNLIRKEMSSSLTIKDIFVCKMTGKTAQYNTVIYSNKSIDFISINTSPYVSSTVIASKFTDIGTDNVSEDSLVVAQSNSDWENISITNDDDLSIYLQNSKYGILLFKSGTVTEVMKYSTVVSSSVTKSDILYNFKILRAKGKYFLANKSSGNKIINNGYGIFISSNGGVSRQYADSAAFHSGDIGDMVYDSYHNCVYFTSYRDKTIFDYDTMATTAAFDIDAYISSLSYYELTKLLKNLMAAQSSTTGTVIMSLLEETDEDSGSFTNSIDDILPEVVDMSLESQQASQNAVLNSTISSDIVNLKTAQELFGDDDVTSDDFNADMTADFITNYPGYISTSDNDTTETFTVAIDDSDLTDINGDGKIDDTDRNWYVKLLNGGSLDSTMTADKWFENATNGLYGNGIGSLTSLRLTYNAKIKMLARFRAEQASFIMAGKPLSSDDVDSSSDGPNAIIDPITDKNSSSYKWYYDKDFASFDFENSDENGESSWSS